MVKTKINKKKICSRSHEFYGNGPCPQCWPGYYKRKVNSKLNKNTKKLR